MCKERRGEKDSSGFIYDLKTSYSLKPLAVAERALIKPFPPRSFLAVLPKGQKALVLGEVDVRGSRSCVLGFASVEGIPLENSLNGHELEFVAVALQWPQQEICPLGLDQQVQRDTFSPFLSSLHLLGVSGV